MKATYMNLLSVSTVISSWSALIQDNQGEKHQAKENFRRLHGRPFSKMKQKVRAVLIN